LRHWPGLTVFLDDGRIEMDTNVVERAIRPHTLTRKNALFAGSDGGARRWAIAMTLIQTAKLNGVDPQAWLTDVLECIVSRQIKANELHRLLPWNWRAANAETAATHPAWTADQVGPTSPRQINPCRRRHAYLVGSAYDVETQAGKQRSRSIGPCIGVHGLW
jgi:hypothetical protein